MAPSGLDFDKVVASRDPAIEPAKCALRIDVQAESQAGKVRAGELRGLRRNERRRAAPGPFRGCSFLHRIW